MAFLLEFWRFLNARKRYWLVPIMLTLVLAGALLALAEGSILAPFIYSLF